MFQRVLVGVKTETPFHCPTTRHRYRGHSDPVSVSLPLWFCCHQRSATAGLQLLWLGGRKKRTKAATDLHFLHFTNSDRGTGFENFLCRVVEKDSFCYIVVVVESFASLSVKSMQAFWVYRHKSEGEPHSSS